MRVWMRLEVVWKRQLVDEAQKWTLQLRFNSSIRVEF